MTAVLASCGECGEQVVLTVGDLCTHLPDPTADDGGCGGHLTLLGPAVWVLHTHGPEGDDVTLHATEESARTHLEAYAAHVIEAAGANPAATPAEAVEQVFGEDYADWYTITPQVVLP